jgi:hypothetical protein
MYNFVGLLGNTTFSLPTLWYLRSICIGATFELIIIELQVEGFTVRSLSVYILLASIADVDCHVTITKPRTAGNSTYVGTGYTNRDPIRA